MYRTVYRAQVKEKKINPIDTAHFDHIFKHQPHRKPLNPDSSTLFFISVQQCLYKDTAFF